VVAPAQHPPARHTVRAQQPGADVSLVRRIRPRPLATSRTRSMATGHTLNEYPLPIHGAPRKRACGVYQNCSELLQSAIDAARTAGEILLRYRGRVKARQKGPNDLVTKADLEAEAAIRDYLLQHYPEHGFLGEESPELAPPSGELRWIVDPLDGTANYLHGLDLFATSIAAESPKGLLLGVIYAPALDELYYAAREQGAWCNGERIHVSTVHELANALLVTGFPPRPRRRPELLELFAAYCEATHAVRRLGSAAMDLAYVAAGRFDGFYATHLHAWDCAAGVLLIEEAGGRISKLNGEPFDLYTPDLLASNGLIHDEMIRIARRVLGAALGGE